MLVILASTGSARTDAFAVGLIVGILLGLLAGPVVRSLIARREWRDAAREAALTENLIELIERESRPQSADGGLPASNAQAESWRRSR